MGSLRQPSAEMLAPFRCRRCDERVSPRDSRRGPAALATPQPQEAIEQELRDRILNNLFSSDELYVRFFTLG
jgi:hypothetical protein